MDGPARRGQQEEQQENSPQNGGGAAARGSKPARRDPLEESMEELSVDTVMDAAVARAEVLEAQEPPPAEPYKFKYQAREVLEEAREVLGQCQDRPVDVARLDARIGINQFLTEENGDAEKSLLAAVSVLEGPELWPELSASWSEDAAQVDGVNRSLDAPSADDLINAYNYLGILWSHRADGSTKAKRYLERAKTLFSAAPPHACKADAELREELHTNTLFFLAQVETALGHTRVGTRLCVQTLRRQLALGHSFEPLRWARDVVAVSHIFWATEGQTRVAAHMVACAFRALEECSENASEEFLQVEADAFRAKGALYQEILHKASALNGLDGTTDVPEAWQSADEQLRFEPDLVIDQTRAELDKVPPTAQTVSDFASAREIFKTANAAFERAKAFYVLDGFVSDHVAILQSQSTLLRLLALYEADLKRFAKMQVRREKLMSHLLNQLNLDTYMVQHQEIAFDLGGAARDLLSARRQEIEADGADRQVLTNAEVKRINDAALKVVKYYSHFVTTFEKAEEADRKRSGEETSEEFLVPFLSSHFWIAHAYLKMVPPDQNSVPARVLLIKEGLKYFEKTRDLANARLSNDSRFFVEEKKVATEMAELLPQKIDQVQRGFNV